MSLAHQSPRAVDVVDVGFENCFSSDPHTLHRQRSGACRYTWLPFSLSRTRFESSNELQYCMEEENRNGMQKKSDLCPSAQEQTKGCCCLIFERFCPTFFWLAGMCLCSRFILLLSSTSVQYCNTSTKAKARARAKAKAKANAKAKAKAKIP